MDGYRETGQLGNAERVESRLSQCLAVTNDRVVFNIGGNKYRLVVRIVYPVRTIFIRFIGTHSAYDLIDVATV